MEAKLKVTSDVTIITLSGRLNIEETQSFQRTCLKHFTGKKVVFNMEKVNFVGSTGIQPFFDTVKTLTESGDHGVKLVSVQPELKRIFQNIENQKLEFHETETSAVLSLIQKPAA